MAKTALVTGASAGLGAQYARLFARDGHALVLVARRKDRLDDLAVELREQYNVTVYVLPADLAAPEAPARLYAELAQRSIEVDFLVNNAGFGANGAFATLDLMPQLEMIQVNVVALTQLTRLLLPAMLTRGSGRILNIGSTAGFQPGPYMAVYYATKAFVNSFSEALAQEVRDSGVTVTLSCPGPTATEFSQVAGNEKTKLFQSVVMDAETVAREGYAAMLGGKVMAVHGLKNKAMLQALRISPRFAARRFVATVNRSIRNV